MRLVLFVLMSLLCISLVSGAVVEVGSPVHIGSKQVVLDQTGSDPFGNYALFSVGSQRMKIYEKNQKSLQGVSIYVDGVSDETGVLHDSAIVFINGAERNYLGQRFGDYWYQLRRGDSVTYDGHLIIFERVNGEDVEMRVGSKIVHLPLSGETVAVQGISLLVHRLERKGSGHALTLRVHTLPSATIPLQETTKVVSLGNLAIIQGKMTQVLDVGKSAFSPPFAKLKNRVLELKARFL